MNRQKQNKRLYLMKFLGFIDLEIVDKGYTRHIRPLSSAGTSLKENKAQVSFQRLTSKIQVLVRASQGATLQNKPSTSWRIATLEKYPRQSVDRKTAPLPFQSTDRCLQNW